MLANGGAAINTGADSLPQAHASFSDAAAHLRRLADGLVALEAVIPADQEDRVAFSFVLESVNETLADAIRALQAGVAAMPATASAALRAA